MSFIRKLAIAVLLVAVAGGLAFWFASAPRRLDAAVLTAAPSGDAASGERVFWAGGCASCHARPGSEGEARLQLAGGVELDTPFGAFVAPNISQHTDGIGGWSFADFANAMMRGVSPEGAHYYPAFPYTSYTRMEIADIADLFAYLKTLPAVAGEAPGNRVAFPFNVRRGLGLWKHLFLSHDKVVALADPSDVVRRGQYLVEGPGHCGECHTPRYSIGGTDKSRWLAGAPAAAGQGRVPNITPGSTEAGAWNEADIANFLETGFTPEFDSAGGQMAEVVRTLAELPAEDREAISAYLKSVPAISE